MLFKRLFARRAESKAANLQPDQIQHALESPEVSVRRDACRALTDLDLLRPIYKETARHGHFGRNLPEFTWEQTHRTSDLRTACGI